MPVVLWACASLPPQVAHEPVAAFARPSDTGLGALAASAAEPHAGRSGFMVLDTGHEAFLQRARLIEAAERSVDAQYYIWNSDRSGHYLACRLYAAAERGVRVRLILDDMNILGRDAVIAALDRHPNVAVRIFNPNPNRGGFGKWLAFGAEFQRLNRRMHNKSFTVDAAFGIVGGRNIGDEYFDLHPAANFRDRDVLAAGPIVERISANFDAYWNTELSYPVGLLAPATEGAEDDGAAIRQACVAAEEAIRLALGPVPAADEARVLVERALAGMTWAEAELVFDPPASGRETGSDEPGLTALALQALVDETREEILVESAYFILGDEQLERLTRLRTEGIRVAVVYIGSFNINLRSMYLNSETVLLIHSRELAGQVAEAIELAMAPANSWRVTKGSRGGIAWSGRDGERWTHEPVTGYWHRVRASLFRLVPMEKYL